MTKHPDCEDRCQVLEHKGYHSCTHTGRCEHLEDMISRASKTPRMDAAAGRAHATGKQGEAFVIELAEQYRVEGRQLESELENIRDQRDTFEELYAGSGFAVPSAFVSKQMHLLAMENGRLRFLLGEAITSMSHAEIFIGSREKMHPEGRRQWGELIDQMRGVIEAPQDCGNESAKLVGGE